MFVTLSLSVLELIKAPTHTPIVSVVFQCKQEEVDKALVHLDQDYMQT